MISPAPTPPLAHAFLALADDGEPADQRSLTRALVAAVATVLLICATPPAWTASPRGKSVTQPAALSSKPSIADDE
jgi:hypothetical protein